MPRVRPVIKIRCAAYHFARITRDICEIAKAFSVSESTIRKWKSTDEWEETLCVIGYEGPRRFLSKLTRDASREKSEQFENVRCAYIELFRSGEVPARIPRLVEEQTGVPRRTVSEWAMRHKWRFDAWKTKGDA